jgi:hypothetical protein
LCDFVNPFGHGLALATGPRASNDDRGRGGQGRRSSRHREGPS